MRERALYSHLLQGHFKRCQQMVATKGTRMRNALTLGLGFTRQVASTYADNHTASIAHDLCSLHLIFLPSNLLKVVHFFHNLTLERLEVRVHTADEGRDAR